MRTCLFVRIGLVLVIQASIGELTNAKEDVACCGNKASSAKKRSARHVHPVEETKHAMHHNSDAGHHEAGQNNGRKIKRSNVENKDTNAMLLLDSSNGFERAIENDIDELNNPVIKNQARSAIQTPNGSETGKNGKSLSSEQGPTHEGEGKVSPPSEDGFKNAGHTAFALVSQTALQYSDYLLEEMRLLSQMQTENGGENNTGSNEQTNQSQQASTSAPPPPYAPPMASGQYSNTPYTYQSSVAKPNQVPIATGQTPNEQYAYQSPEAKPTQFPVATGQHPNEQYPNQSPDAKPIGSEASSSKCGQWSEWSPCNETCGEGTSTRYRECYDDKNEKKLATQSKPCKNPECLYCTFWSFTICSKICGDGTKLKSRTCYMNNGTSKDEKVQENCNSHACQPECGLWSDWSTCSKPCGTGVTIRNRTCILGDGLPQAFYEQHSCNTEPCNRSPDSNSSEKKPEAFTYADQLYHFFNQENGCLSAHLTFEKYQYNVHTYFDDTDEHNDVEYQGTVNFKGNRSCGYSVVFTGKKSVFKFYDDIFRNFENKDLSVMMWLYPISNPLVDGTNQTIFDLSSTVHKFGHYVLTLDTENHLVLKMITDSRSKVVVSEQTIPYSKWVHLSVVVSEDKDIMDIYLNGRKIQAHKTTEPGQTEGNSSTEPEKFQAFGNDQTMSSSLSGVMDEVFVSKCTMTAEGIRVVANTCKEREGKSCPSPIHGLCSATSEQEKPEPSEPSEVAPQAASTPLYSQPS